MKAKISTIHKILRITMTFRLHTYRQYYLHVNRMSIDQKRYIDANFKWSKIKTCELKYVITVNKPKCYFDDQNAEKYLDLWERTIMPKKL